jgi:hypothetical protein
VVVYDKIGTTYAVTRRPDPRIGALNGAAPSGARSVINIGAGAGSYEPPQTVLAVEPSTVMISQRPGGSAPVVQARAEALPVADRAADAAMALLTVHHWTDLMLGGARIEPVPIPHDCTDGFATAYWRRPGAYLDPVVRAGMSILAQPGDDVLRAGLDRLASDLDSGAWYQRYHDLNDLAEFDGGYRLLTAELGAPMTRGGAK